MGKSAKYKIHGSGSNQTGSRFRNKKQRIRTPGSDNRKSDRNKLSINHYLISSVNYIFLFGNYIILLYNVIRGYGKLSGSFFLAGLSTLFWFGISADLRSGETSIRNDKRKKDENPSEYWLGMWIHSLYFMVITAMHLMTIYDVSEFK